MPMLSDKRSKQCRATAYRLLRHALVDSESVKRLEQHLDWFIVKLALFHLLLQPSELHLYKGR
jgi:Rapamycin-insensitive companion of mTOR, N-term